MAKKQIKELIIKTSSPGSDKTNKDLQSITKALEEAGVFAQDFNKKFGGSSKVVNKVAKEIQSIERSLSGAAKSAKSFNSALNGDTKTATRKISAYIENIELLTISMKDLADEANRAYPTLARLGNVSSGSSNQLKMLTDTVENISGTLTALEEAMDQLNETMKTNTRYVRESRNNLGELFVSAERTEEGIEGLTNAHREYTQSSRKAGAATRRHTNDARRLAGAGSQSARAFSDLAFRMNPLVSLYASVAVNVYAVTEAFRVLNEAANLNRLNEQSAKFAATLSGINIKGLAADLQELSGYSISTGDALRQSVRGVSYGFLAEDLERLTVGARKASVALGLNFADAIDRAFRGIAKQEVEVLDEIGVVTRLETAFKKFSVQLNKSADDLTETERRMALTAEVISQLESRFSSFSVQATGIEQLNVAMKDLVDSTLILASSGLDSYAKDLAAIVRGLGGVRSAQVRVTQAQEVYNAAIAQGNFSQAAVAYEQVQQALVQLRQEQVKGTDAYEDYQKSVVEAQNAQVVLNRALAAGYTFAIAYGVVLTTNVVKATVGATIATYKFASALVTSKAVTAIASAAVALYNAAMIAYTSVTLIGVKATLAFVASASLAAAPITLTVAAVGALIVGIGALVNYISDGWVFKKISEFFSWIGQKLSDFLSWLGSSSVELGADIADAVGSGLDAIAENQGISNATQDFLKLSDAVKVTDDQVKNYLKTLENANKKSALMVVTPFRAEEPVKLPTADEARANLQYMNTLTASVEKIGEATQELQRQKSPFDTISSSLAALADIPVNLQTSELRKLRGEFEALQREGKISLDIEFNDGLGFKEAAEQAKQMQQTFRWFTDQSNFGVKMALGNLTAGDPEKEVTKLSLELQNINRLLEDSKNISDAVVGQKRQEWIQTRLLLEAEKERATQALNYARASRALEVVQTGELEALRRQTDLESVILEKQILQLRVRIQTAIANGQNVKLLQQELALLNQRLGFAKQDEALQLKKLQHSNRIAELERMQSSSGTAQARVAIQKQINAEKQKEIDLMKEGIEKERAQAELDRQKDQTGREGDSAGMKDFSSIAASMASMPGLSDLQSTFLSTTSTITDVYATFQENMKNSSQSFFDFLKGDIESFGQVATAGLQFAQGVFQQASQAKVASINREIEAEKRRDGQSAESKEKIKRLEAKRIKEEAKAKKASIIMSTATAVMQGFAQGGPIVGSILAVPTIAMGMMQLSQIDKAAAGQVAGLNDSGGNLSLSGGKRGNEVDVSSRATAGELSYLRGESGTGSISNFTPGRASGNYASAGTSITVGESGPEEITPAMPVNVSPSGKTSESKIVFSPVIHAQAVDATGMEELLTRYSRELYEGLEAELRARNKTLESL